MNSPKSRYPFAPISEGAFLFVTDSGCYYTVDVSEAPDRFGDNKLLTNNGEVFEISFDKDGDYDRHDESVGGTILFILGSNMAAKGDTCVYYYVCDTSDGYGKHRARLFDWWFLYLQEEIPSLMKHNFIVPGFSEGEEYDVSLFIFENHPHYKEYIAEFERSLDENFSKQNYQ